MMSLTKKDTLYLLSAMYAEAEKTFIQIKKQFPLWATGEDTRRGEYLTALCQTWASQIWLIKELSTQLGHELPELQRQEFNRLVVLDWTVNDIKKALHSPLIDRDFILHELERTEKLRKNYFFFSLFPQDLTKHPDIYLNMLQYFLNSTNNIEAMDNDALLASIRLGQSYFNIYQTSSKSLHSIIKLTDPMLIAFHQRLIDLKTHYRPIYEKIDTHETMANIDSTTVNKITKTYDTLSGLSTFSLEKLAHDKMKFSVAGNTGLKGNKLAIAEKRIYQDMLSELETPKPKPAPMPLEVSLFEHVTLRERSRVEVYEPDEEMITVNHQQSATTTAAQQEAMNPSPKPSLVQNLGNQLTRFFAACKRLIFPDLDVAFLARSKASRDIKQSQITQTMKEPGSETEQQVKVQMIKTVPIKRAQSVTEVKDDDDLRPNGPKVR